MSAPSQQLVEQAQKAADQMWDAMPAVGSGPASIDFPLSLSIYRVLRRITEGRWSDAWDEP